LGDQQLHLFLIYLLFCQVLNVTVQINLVAVAVVVVVAVAVVFFVVVVEKFGLNSFEQRKTVT